MKASKLILIGAAFTAGCTSIPSVGPNYHEPEFDIAEQAVPDAGLPTTNLTATCEYEPAATNADTRIVISRDELARWWERFEDPLLEDLIVSAVSNNASYRAVLARVEQRNWELFGSYSAFLPHFSVNGEVTRKWNRPNVPSGGYAHNDFTLKQGAINGDWEIDLFGGNRRYTEMAVAIAEAAQWTAADVWLSLTTQVGESYISLRTIQEEIAIARTNLVLQSETYDILKSRLDSGIGDELAVHQCAYNVEQTRAAVPALLAQEEQLKNRLAILAGEMPGVLHEALAPVVGERDWLLPPQKVASIPLDLIRARPDVKAKERQLAAQCAAIGVAKAAWFPRLFINGSVGLAASNGVKLFDHDSFFATLGPSVSWPIFQAGRIYSNVKAEEEKTKAAILEYEEAIENAYAEIRNAYSAYTTEYHRFKALEVAVKAATDAVTISRDLYQNGLKDFNNVLDAQRSRLSVEDSLARSRGQITMNLIALYRALGGGLDPEAE